MTSFVDCIPAGTHLVPMTMCLAVTKGAVLELGAGDWSTPFLRRYCMAADRELLTLENYPKWAAEFGVEVGDYDVTIPKAALRQWSVVLIDHRPAERRVEDLLRFVGQSDFILLHDHHDYVQHLGRVMERDWAWTRIENDTLVLCR